MPLQTQVLIVDKLCEYMYVYVSFKHPRINMCIAIFNLKYFQIINPLVLHVFTADFPVAFSNVYFLFQFCLNK